MALRHLWTRLALLLWFAALGAAPAQEPPPLTLDNGLLRVTLDAATGALAVSDLQTGAAYQQPDSFRDSLQCPPGAELRIPRTATAPTLDARVGEWADATPWRLDPAARTSEKPWSLDGEADLSAAVAFRWDEQRMYALWVVLDDRFAPGTRDSKDWWEYDAVEWWAGWDQIGLPASGDAITGFAWGDWKDWAQAVSRPVADFAAEPEALALLERAGLAGAGHAGWVLESATDLAPLIQLHNPAPGRRFRFAYGIDDRDAGTEREAQEYGPAGVNLGSRLTYAVGLLCDDRGEAPAEANLADDGRPPLCRDAIQPDAETLEYTLTSDLPEATVGSVRCTVRLAPGSRDLSFSSAMLDGWEANVPIGRGFLPVEGPSDYVIPWYGDGVLVSTEDLNPPGDYLGVFSGLDMPGLGVIGPEGAALCLFDDYDLMESSLRPAQWRGRQVLGLLPILGLERGKRLPAYRVTWHFAPAPTYMALADRMREFCAEQGWVRTLAEKRAVNPNLSLLYGAPDVWGASGLAFAREAATAGVHHMLINGRFPRADMEEMVRLGYLVGEYDNYVDCDDSTMPVDGVKPVPNFVRREKDGALSLGWLTLDKSKQYYSRCSATAVGGARTAIPGILKDFPYNARFLDVHTAMGLVECYSEEHPCSKTDDRKNKMALLDYVRELGLVLGGEHGRAWSVPGLDYQEGMMSHNMVFSWPAGHLVKVDKPEQVNDAYLTYGIGFERRVPFWELVFHDCVVSTWYWGDSIGYLDRVRPDLTDRKVAFTALYGTIPLFWATDLDLGFTGRGKERWLEAYRNCSMVSEAVAEQRMVAHRYVSADRAVQETEFADGTRVAANFADDSREVELAGRQWTLPSNGIVAEGPTLHEHVALVDSQRQTSIVRPDWRFHDGHGTVQEGGGIRSDGPVTVQTVGEDRLRVSLEPRTGAAELDLAAILGHAPGAVRLVELAPDLSPKEDVAVGRDGDRVTLAPPHDWRAYECLVGAAAEKADVGLDPRKSQFWGDRQAGPPTVALALVNRGAGEARRTLVARWADGAEAARREVLLAGGQGETVTFAIDPGPRDGRRSLLVTLEGGDDELITADNTARLTLRFDPDWTRLTWRRLAAVDLGGIARTDAVVECPAPDLAGVEPASVRVALARADGKPQTLLASQLDAPVAAGGASTLRFVLPGEWTGAESPRVLVLGAPVGGFFAPEGGGYDPATTSVTRETYRAALGEGAIRPLWFRTTDERETEALRQVIFSSPDTGWGEDGGGEIRSLEMLADGPVCTVVRVVKQLPTDVTVTRTYTCYPRYVVSEIDATKLCVGLFSRVWYRAKGTYEDSAGHTAMADGTGKEEGVSGQCPSPRWFGLRAADWTHLCVALSPFDNMAYWDEGEAYGQCGFTTSQTTGNRVAHVLVGPDQPADYAEAWQRALSQPPTVEWGE